MYCVEVSDHIMVAHSLPHPIFGPAQGVHGATFVVDVAFYRDALSAQNIVVDIGRAIEVLKAVLAPLHYANLDDIPEFSGKLTTTEFLCRHIFDQFARAAKSGELGEDGAGVERIRVSLSETPLARASFEGQLRG